MKIALIDSHLIFTEALKINLLNALPAVERVDTYTSIENFVARKNDYAPDIVISELSFYGKYDKGVDALFRAVSADTKVIILTSLNDDWLIRSYMRLGAKAFLTKTCPSQELITAIAQVRKGNLFLSEDVQKILSVGISTGTPSADYLSSIERAILEALSRDEPFRTIADNLNISMIEFKYHRRMLMERFNVKHFVSLVDLTKKPGFLKTRNMKVKAMADTKSYSLQ
ncbi:DNA-binding response regulator, NarL/FixJ family, contains REC and HTH domains [Dyadobacter soli]|uniref:DNA-binding response regulator, NarL/FixJ family, contains REC and HTH domains n=1 Tax=Dyadobacter soli TaxID=659014 RepID=A0A1G6Y913_9BACT|nr:response regulator transcription factor [Dyadobacter soli]SDD86888.1 DNA-binding response regulator, NarL/FixJ family, contains REC and HTH domains [Dyadobacter soli]